jgi:hypothetical protein
MIDGMEDFEVEPLSDEALESVAGGKSSEGPACCSCWLCSNSRPDAPDGGTDGGTTT